MKRFLIITLILTGFTLLFVSSYIYAQDDGFQPDEYVGVEECSACHRNARDYASSPHALTLQAAAEGVLLADFTQGEAVRTVALPDAEAAPFTAENVAFVVGAGRYMQAYLYQVAENDYRILPAIWNTIDGTWQPYGSSENWLEDPAHDWEQSCAGCHTTGYSVETMTWSDPAVQCEACHGPGGGHVNLANNLPRRADEADIQEVRNGIVNSPDAQICGQCHSQGLSADGAHPFPVGYLPGEDLSEHFTVIAEDNDDYWWATGHGERKYMQYNEWLFFGHSGALQNLKELENADPACMTCHSEDYRYNQRIIEAHEAGDWEGVPPELPTIESAQFGVTCTSCHNPHLTGEDNVNGYFLRDAAYNQCVACHNDSEVTEGLHHPEQEMYEGQSVSEALDAVVEPVPSAHFAAENGPDCITCHMQRVPVTDSPGGRSSHSQQLVMPGVAEAEGIESACGSCHADAVDPVAIQSLIQATQTGIANRLEEIHANLSGDEPEWVTLAVDYVEGDASLGIHNYVYTTQLLTAVETEIGLVAQTGEITLPEVIIEADPAGIQNAPEEDSALEPEEDSLAPVTLAVMGLSVLLILIAGYFFYFRTQTQDEVHG